MKKLSILALSIVLLPLLLLTPMAAQSAGVLSLSQTNINVGVGQNVTVNAYPLNGQIVNQTGNSNTYVALANVSNNVITIYGIGSGSTQMTFCTYDNTCGTIFVTIGGSNFTNITFSQNPVNLNFQQSTTVTIYGNSSSGFNFYVSSNSNTSVVSASISGSSLFLYGQMQGSSVITVCQTNNSCGTLSVTVGFGGSSGTLTLNTTTLPQYTVNQFYSSQLVVSGGNSPYNFSLSSGTLPPGITLGFAGQISGTAFNSGTYTFSVRVTDSFSRSFYSPTLTLSAAGSVLGSQTYNNGTLVNDNGTIYITYKNLKSAFANMPAFRGLGYNLNNVLVGSTSSLFSSGFVIGSANIAHPWGSWVKYGTTIYFVHETGLVPISSYDIFLTNGGPAAGVVNANSYDLIRPILSVMSYNDTRLK